MATKRKAEDIDKEMELFNSMMGLDATSSPAPKKVEADVSAAPTVRASATIVSRPVRTIVAPGPSQPGSIGPSMSREPVGDQWAPPASYLPIPSELLAAQAAADTLKVQAANKLQEQYELEKEWVANSDDKKTLRAAGGITWQDNSLAEWPENDFRMFVGDLGPECTDDTLRGAFCRYDSFARAKVVKDKQTNKSRGYGFVSFLDSKDYLQAYKDMQGKYIGSRPVKLRKSTWQERQFDNRKAQEREEKKMLKFATKR